MKRIFGRDILFFLFFAAIVPATLATVPLSAAAPAADICPTVSSVDSILRRWDTCSASDFLSHASGRGLVGVLEGNEASLQRVLNLVNNNSREYISMLFYASWCPFSKTLRPNFTILSSMFPTIHHFAVEESSVRPSILSRYGVHGFPTLFLLNSTTRVRYHGSRTLDSLVLFYNSVTGLKPASLDGSAFEKIWEQLNPSKPKEAEQECPFSWAQSPEKLLRQETYLGLATAFVLLRLLHFLFPTLIQCVEHAWRRQVRNARLMQLLEHPQVYFEQAMQAFRRMKPCKRSNLQEGAMNAKAWASKSLASVAIGEASSSRASLVGEKR